MMPAFRAAFGAVLVFAALGVTTVPTVAAACTTTESLVGQIRQASPDVDIRHVKEPSATRVRAGISALIGQQVPMGGQYLIAHALGSSTSYVVRFEGGCATHHGRFPHDLVRTWLEGSPV